MTKTAWPKEPLTNADMQILHGVLVDWCRNNACDPSSDRGKLAAKALVGWHEFGIHDAAELAQLMRDEVVVSNT